MISTIKIELNEPENFKLNCNISSLLHGYIMENVGSEFANEMHISDIRPFSQSLSRDNSGRWVWRVTALTDSANENIINMLTEQKNIYLKYKDLQFDILNYSVHRTSYEQLFENNYLQNDISRYISFKLITPTAFKSNGRYINYPDLRLFFMSLIKKYDKNSDSTQIFDEKLIKKLTTDVEIVKYNLRSTYFSLEGVKIPSYWGDITIKVNCDIVTVKLVNMLVDFAQYSGVGIKNALGMGGLIKLEK